MDSFSNEKQDQGSDSISRSLERLILSKYSATKHEWTASLQARRERRTLYVCGSGTAASRAVRQSDGFEERARRRVHYDNGGIRFDRARYVHDVLHVLTV